VPRCQTLRHAGTHRGRVTQDDCLFDSSCPRATGRYDGVLTAPPRARMLDGQGLRNRHGGSAMSRTLNLVDGLLLMGRRHQQLGRTRDALTIFARLASFRELPREVAEETQVRLGEIQLRRRKYRRARRHLAVALRYDPDNARYHYLLATALRKLGEDHWDRAATHYRRSLALAPDQDECLTEFGVFAVRLGHAEEGLRWLRQAVERKPADPDVLSKLVEGLRLAG